MRRRFFKAWLLLFLALGALGSKSFASEQFNIVYDSVNDSWTLEWNGQAGRTYFLQTSPDLETFSWMPTVEAGDGSLIQYGITATGPKGFFRLHHTDVPMADPINGDADGDGLSNLQEVQNDIHPLLADTDGDGISDGIEFTSSVVDSRFDPLNSDADGNGIDDGFDDFDGDGFSNAAESQFGGDPADGTDQPNPAPRYALIELDTTVDSGAIALNNIGQVIGRSPGSNWYWNQGTLSTLNGSSSSGVTGINDSGVIVGFETYTFACPGGGGGSETLTRASVWNTPQSAPTNIGDVTSASSGSCTGNWWATGAYAVNNQGTIVGIAQSQTFYGIAREFSPTQQTLLDLGADTITQAIAINDQGDWLSISSNFGSSVPSVRLNGQVVGSGHGRDLNNAGTVVGSNGSGQAILFTGNDAGVLAASGSAAAINNATRPAIVGLVSESGVPNSSRPFLWEKTEPTPENPNPIYVGIELQELISKASQQEWQLASAVDINDSGLIVGSAIHYNLNPDGTRGTEIGQKAVLLLPIELTWEKVDGDYPDLEDNINPFTDEVQGQRIFSGKKTPTDSRRNKVKVKVDVKIPNATVYVKAFDVDDPTPKSFDTGDEIDPNDSSTEGVGNDNREDHVIPSGKETGFFTSSNTATANKQSNANGIAEFEFNVGMQPGNNYRVVASVINEDLYANVQVTDPSASGYLGPDEDDTPTPASPLLTVWRKLNIEIDRMNKWEDNKPMPDRAMVTGVSWDKNNPTGRSTLTLSQFLPQVHDFYLGGVMKSGSTLFDVVGNGDNTLTIFHGSQTPSQAEYDAFIGEFELLDDDDRASGFATVDLLPVGDVINARIKENYTFAYIDINEIEVGASADKNQNPSIPFERNLSHLNPLTNLLSNQDLDGVDEGDYWYHFVAIAYQGATFLDGDPAGEAQLRGVAISPGAIPIFGRYSVVYVETVRDKLIPVRNNPDFLSRLQKDIDKVTAHEIGHAPQSGGNDADHAEGGLMDADVSGDQFTSPTIERFRTTPSWQADLNE